MTVTLNKYTQALHGLAYLKEGFLRFSPLHEFNDPFEMRPYIESPHEALTGVYLGVNIDAKDREQFLHLLPTGKSVSLFQFELEQQGYSLIAQQIN